MQPYPALQQCTVQVSPQRSANMMPIKALGIVQIVLGLLSCIIGGFIIPFSQFSLSYIGAGIIAGIPITIGGIFGVCYARRSTTCWNVTNLVFGILSCLVSSMQVFYQGFAVAILRSRSDCGYWYITSGCSSRYVASITLHVSLLLISVAVFGASIAVAVYCCKFGCRCCDNASQRVILQSGQPQAMFAQSSAVSYHGQPQQFGFQQQIPYSSTTGYAQSGSSVAVTYVQPSVQPIGLTPQKLLDELPPYSST